MNQRLETEFQHLNADAHYFEITVIRDSVQRLRYHAAVRAVRDSLLSQVNSGALSADAAAQMSFDTRNAIRRIQQSKLSEFGLSFSQLIERERTFAELLESRSQSLFRKSFGSLNGFESRSRVYVELIRENMPNPLISRATTGTSILGIGLIILTAVHIVEEVVRSDYKLQTAIRSLTLLGYTLMGAAIGQRIGAAGCTSAAATGPAAPWVYGACVFATSALGGAVGTGVGEAMAWLGERR